MHLKNQRLFGGAIALVSLSSIATWTQAQHLVPVSLDEERGSSSRSPIEDAHASEATAVAVPSAHHGFFQNIGIDAHTGINGLGGNIALPLTRHFNARIGGEYFHYSTSFTEQGANVDASLKLGNGKVALDWYPFHSGFRVSPQMVFAIQTQASGTVLVPSGSTISLNGQNYISSTTDPLHGSGLVTTRKAAPGISIGWGNISPRGEGHLTFPVEVGFYYIGQPNLQVNFTGSACDPTVPQTIGCENVDQDPSFQASLRAFIARNQHNVSYASFFPIASVGIGFRF